MSSGGGKGGADIDYTQSPQQKQLMQMLMPTLGQMFGMEFTPGTPAIPGQRGPQIGETDAGAPTYGPGTPGTPATAGAWTQTGEPWQPPAGLSPTADWYSNLSPDVMTGLQQPYIEAQQQGLELLGAGGAAGSARGGASGTAGAMTGEIMGQMAQNVPLQAWQMGADQRRALMMPYQAATGMMGSTMPEAVVSPGSSNTLGGLGGVGAYAGLGSLAGLSATPLGAMLSYGLGSGMK